MKKLKHFKKRFSILLLILVLTISSIAVFYVVSMSAGKTKIYFYSTEANINNFKSLKMEFDRYLSKLGPYEFQPFSARDVFEKQIKGKDNCLLLLSSWHYRHIHKPYNLTAMLTGLRNGQKYQQKIVVAGEKSADIIAQKTGLVASAGSWQYTAGALDKMLQKSFARPFQILTVPKDIDALMSVGFGMARMAFASDMAFEELKGINPKLCNKMKIVARGEETLRLIFAFPEGFSRDRQKAVQLIQDMGGDSEGKKRIRMLGLDGWEKLDASDRLKLES